MLPLAKIEVGLNISRQQLLLLLMSRLQNSILKANYLVFINNLIKSQVKIFDFGVLLLKAKLPNLWEYLFVTFISQYIVLCSLNMHIGPKFGRHAAV